MSVVVVLPVSFVMCLLVLLACIFCCLFYSSLRFQFFAAFSNKYSKAILVLIVKRPRSYRLTGARSDSSALYFTLYIVFFLVRGKHDAHVMVLLAVPDLLNLPRSASQVHSRDLPSLSLSLACQSACLLPRFVYVQVPLPCQQRPGRHTARQKLIPSMRRRRPFFPSYFYSHPSTQSVTVDDCSPRVGLIS